MRSRYNYTSDCDINTLKSIINKIEISRFFLTMTERKTKNTHYILSYN